MAHHFVTAEQADINKRGKRDEEILGNEQGSTSGPSVSLPVWISLVPLEVAHDCGKCSS